MDATHRTPQQVYATAVEGSAGPQATSAINEWSELDWNQLPQGLQDLKELVGPGAALILAEEFGGGDVYVPTRIREDHPLVRLIGQDRVRSLSLVYGGDKLHVPKADAIERQFRTRRIVSLRRTGRTVASLAREFNLTCRRVRQICSA